jgi:serine/threonine protein kinase
MPISCPSCQAANDDDADSCFTCGKPLQATVRLGSVVAGRYEILAQLGKGGMGVVYRAHDKLLDETVAIKVLRPDVARDPEIARRFQSEIKLARRVSHRNVCRIHEYGEDAGGLRYISMEMMEGVDLRQVLRRQGGLPTEEALRTALQVAEGLAAIHEMGVIHRDLKTPNIMRDAKGTVRLMDFGIAKEWGASTSATATGLVMGTPEYMSPEQARGEKIDFRSDIYALGIILYELFTGHVPFRAETPLATILKHLQEPPPLDGPSAAVLPEPVKAILRRALAKQADQRYATAQDMVDALRAAQPGPARREPTTAGHPTPTLEMPITEVPTQARVATRGAAVPARQSAPLTMPTQSGLDPTLAGPSQATPARPQTVPPGRPVGRPLPGARPQAPPSRLGLVLGLAGGALVVMVLTGVVLWKLVQRAGQEAAVSPSPGPSPSSVVVAPSVAPTEQIPVTVAPSVEPSTQVSIAPSAAPPPSSPLPSPQPSLPPATLPRATAPPPALVTPRPPVTTVPVAPALPAAVSEQMQGLASGDSGTRWHAAEALGNMGGEAGPAVPALIPLLQDRVEVVRWRAAEALGKIGPAARPAVPALIAALARPGLLSTEAAKALGRIGGGADVAAALARALHSEEVYTRREAAKGLVRMAAAGAPALDDLVQALRDKDNTVRTESARALGRMGSAARRAAPALTAATRDSDRLVAQTAAQALELVQK